MQNDDDQWISPSFNSYSQNKSAETAAKVAGEAAGDAQSSHDTLHTIAETEDEQDDFQFDLILNEHFELSDTEITFGAKSPPPIFPIFNRDLIRDFQDFPESREEKSDTILVPLRRLFIEERGDEEDPSPSSSSEDGDEAESIPPGSYCIWKPKLVTPSPSTCKKSKSTGFGSKRWKLRDLLRRSNSEGKDSFVFLTPKKKEVIKNSTISNAAKTLLTSKKSAPKTASASASASASVASSPTRRMNYSPASRAMVRGNGSPNRSPRGNGEMQKRKSYLPYRQDLVGFFTTVNGIGRNFSPL